MSFVTILVFPDGRAQIRQASDLDSAFRQWQRRHGVFLPVAAVEIAVESFLEAIGQERLPITAPTESVASLLHRVPVCSPAQPAVFRHYRRIGRDAGPLFACWVSAVRAVAS